jgi:hypothetical protein
MKSMYIEYRLTGYPGGTNLWCKVAGLVNRGIVSRSAFFLICGINRFMMKRQLQVIKRLSLKLANGDIDSKVFPLERSYIKAGLHWWIFCRRRHCPKLMASD